MPQSSSLSGSRGGKSRWSWLRKNKTKSLSNVDDKNRTLTLLQTLQLSAQLFAASLDSVPLPGLKGAIGGALMLVGQIQVRRLSLRAPLAKH